MPRKTPPLDQQFSRLMLENVVLRLKVALLERDKLIAERAIEELTGWRRSRS